MTGIHDIVLIHFEEKPLSFARIEEITADHKPGWYHVTLLMLQVPLQVVTWILRDVYINGEEFTMNGKRMRLERIEAPQPARPPGGKPAAGDKPPPQDAAKVIRLPRKKKTDP
ncbi:MAG TPA: hypothetical protein VK852_10570 [Desulfobacterales bacterium]|jgi:hypothetical protein|nr:hypothetical protein [Desulfobacterales bacterium]